MKISEQLIESVVKNIILEYCGVSDEVMNISSEILSMMLNIHRDFKWKQSATYTLPNGEYGYIKKFNLDPQDDSIIKSIVDNVAITFYGYDSEDASYSEMIEYINEKGLLKASFSPKKSLIIIRIPFPYDGNIGEWGNDYLLSTINHECKHAFQSSRRGGTSITNAYSNSTNRNGIDSSDEAKLYLMKSFIKNCYYVFDLDEVDARLQEIYVQLTKTKDLKKCETYKYMQEAVGKYNWLRNMMYSTSRIEVSFYKNERKIFQEMLTNMLGEGVTEKQFFAYCAKGVKRYREHLKRIVGRFQQENGSYNGSFKQYASNEIPMEYMFKLKKTNPSLWKRLLKRIKMY